MAHLSVVQTKRASRCQLAEQRRHRPLPAEGMPGLYLPVSWACALAASLHLVRACSTICKSDAATSLSRNCRLSDVGKAELSCSAS